MKNNFPYLVVLLVFFQLVKAQGRDEKNITGIITSGVSHLEGINISNTKNKLTSVSDQNGIFSIVAGEGDILRFSGLQYDTLLKLITKQELATDTLKLNMTAATAGIELNEVIINEYSDITAEKLGIIKPGQVKKFTPAERKLSAGSSGVVGFINLLNGEVKKLKANLNVEKKEILLQKLEYMFEDKYYVDVLKIPAELVKGFKYYCVEDAEFAKNVNSKNIPMCRFLIIDLASIYNKNRTSAENAE